jgi:hypothetical protein
MHGHSGTSGLFYIRFRECVTTVKTTFIQYINQLPTRSKKNLPKSRKIYQGQGKAIMTKKNIPKPREPHKVQRKNSKDSGNHQNKYRYHTAHRKNHDR